MSEQVAFADRRDWASQQRHLHVTGLRTGLPEPRGGMNAAEPGRAGFTNEEAWELCAGRLGDSSDGKGHPGRGARIPSTLELCRVRGHGGQIARLQAGKWGSEPGRDLLQIMQNICGCGRA